MNRFSAYPHALPGGQFWGMIRLSRNARPSPIMDKGEKPKRFNTRGEAAEELLSHMVAYMNGNIRGEIFEGPNGSAKIAAESHFKQHQDITRSEPV